MSLGNDEKKFMELRSKLFDELEALERQIADLEERREELTCVLDGSYTVSRFNDEPIETDNTISNDMDPRDRLDATLVDFIAMNHPVKRPAIEEFFESWNLSSDDIRRALERCKRRGHIKVKGKSRAAVWLAVK